MKIRNFTKIVKKTTSIMAIIFILLQTIMPIVSTVKAAERPDNIRVVTDKAEKNVLLGTTSEKARAENILGLASKFSLFTKENITLTGSDAEGKIASGGTITASTSYPYEAGTEVQGETEAKIIAQDGINGNFDLTQTKHTTTTNKSYEPTKKIAAIGINANKMIWSNYSTSQQNQIVASDLIDFDEEFKYLQNQSNYLAGLDTKGKIIKCFTFGRNQESKEEHRWMGKAVVFSGSNKNLNVFTMTISEFNNMFKTFPKTVTTLSGEAPIQETQNIFLDVPSGSKIIINIIGEGTVKLPDEGFHNRSSVCLYCLADEEELKRDTTFEDAKGELLYAVYENKILKDESGNVKTFINKTYNDDSDKYNYNRYDYGNLLYNMPQAKAFSITGTMNGSILAPRATGTDNSYGYVHGTIACNSYSGGIQFGYEPNKIELENYFDVKINKIDTTTKKNIKNVTFEVNDLNGTVIKRWTTSEDVSTVRLKNGSYVLKEISTSENYENSSEKEWYFTVKGNKFYNGENYIIELGGKKEDYNLEANEYILNSPNLSQIRTLKNLYESTGLSSVIGDNVAQEIEVSIDEEGIDNIDDLYYIIASNGGGYIIKDDSCRLLYQPTDWVEFKSWTKVTDGICAKIPVVDRVYNNMPNNSNDGMNVHFYTSDGIEVTDKIRLTELKVKWYTASRTTTEYTTTSSNILLSDIQDTIIITNDHIQTTVEITKQDSDSSKILLQGAIYEIQDSEGNVVKDLEGNKLTFEATDTEGKSTLEDLRLDVGTYYLVEVQAPAYYKISEEKIPFTVKPHTSETITKTVKDEKIKVNVEKQDEYGNLVAGANLQILDKNEKVIKTWTSKNMVEEIEGLSPGEYTLHENYAPTGFMKADDIQFTVTKQGKVTIDEKEVEKIVMINKNLKGTISITKRGETLEEVSRLGKLERYIVYKFVWKENPLENVIYDLYAKNDILVNGTKVYSKDEKITTISTGFDGVADYSGLVAGDYYVMEKCAPNQYEIDNEKHDISLIVTYDENNNQKLIATTGFVNERKKETIELTKTEKGSSNAVDGAIYGLYNQESIGSIAENTLLDVVMTDELGKGKFEADLPVGNYYVKEIEAPNGYLLSEESKYINFNESTDFKINVEDDYIKVNILKTDKNGNALPGAKLQITDKEGNIIVPEWTSEESAKEISKTLNVGETYILEEIEAPDGYVKSANKTFVVLNTAEVQEIVMIDNETKIAINKQDEDRNALAGAKLQLLDENGNQIEEWTSTEKPYEINGKLVVGKKYTIKETKAPDGYIKAEKVIFKVEDTEETQKVEMIDGYTKVKIEKVDENEKYLKGAELQIINEKGNVVEKWTTDNNAHEINKKLLAGGTYTLQEIDAPNGYKKAEDVIFKVSENGEIDTIKMVNIKEETKASEVIKNIVQGALPKTGDAVVIYVIIIIVALGSIVIIIILKNTERKK